LPPSRAAALTTSQGGPADRADIARTTYSVNGSGVKIGVLSDSFDRDTVAGSSYAADVSSGDLPSGVQVVQDYPLTGQTDEGRAMLQLAYDAAPGASLAFATAFISEASFASNIIALRDAGSKIIVDDVSYLTEPMFQDGVIAQAVDTVVASGVSYFSSAGNNARQSYDSTFRTGFTRADNFYSRAAGVPVAQSFRGGITHDFDPSGSTDDTQSFTLASGQYVQMSFQWDTPFASAGGTAATSDMDAYILNSSNQVVRAARTDNVGNDGVEFFSFQNTSGSTQTYQLVLVYRNTVGTSTPTRVKYVNYGYPQGSLQFATNSPTAFGHTNAAGAGISGRGLVG
jgi:hypothetical protein